MKPIEKIGTVKNPDELLSYCRGLPMKSVTKSNYAPGRKEIWIGLGSNLQSTKPMSYEGSSTVFVRHKILTPESGLVVPSSPRIENFLQSVMNRAGIDSWDCCLVATNGGIGWHRDHTIFKAMSVIVNLGASADLQVCTDRNGTPETSEVQSLRLEHGWIVMINTKHLHRSIVSNKDRIMMLVSQFKEGWEKYLPDKYKEQCM